MSGDEKPVILFITHWAGALGGAEISLLDILPAMVRQWDVHLVASESGPLMDRASAAGIDCHVIPTRFTLIGLKRDRLIQTAIGSFAGIISYISFVLRLFSLVKKLRPVLIHANVPKSHAALFLLQVCGYADPACFHIREIFARGSFAGWMIKKFYTGKRSSIVCISNAVKQSLGDTLQRKAVVIHNGVSIPSEIKNEYSVDTGIVRFIYLGRIVPWKGCHILVRIFSELLRRYPMRATLSLTGDTTYWDIRYRDTLSSTIKSLGIEAQCFLRPNTGQPYDALFSHHVFCNASFAEPFGRSIAEAQACGLPVVSFDGGGVSEVIDDGVTGMLVPYGDESAFINAMASFIEHPDRIRSMGKAGHERARTLFNRDIQVPKLCSYFESLI